MIFSTKKSVEVVQKCWGEDKPTKDRAKALGEEFKNLRDMSVTPVIDLIGATVYDHLLIPFSMKAKDMYIHHKRTVSALNFQDLLMMTSRLLRDHPEVRTYFQSKYKTILIDEFQDTDPIQAEIAMFLTGAETEEKVWHRITPREGSLFVVGDPKQSIYGFRRADFRLYKRFREHIENSGGLVVELRTNFRATDDLGDWNNSVFPKLLAGDDQAVFTEMDTVLPPVEGTLSGVSYYRIDEKTIGNIMAAEPAVLARIISHLVCSGEITGRVWNEDGSFSLIKRPVLYKDIMVLARKKRQLEQTANGVAALGIPVRITGADITKRTSEFISFAELIRMLAYPEENAYVYNVMRGDFFGFSDREIYRFIRRGGDFGIYFDFDAFYEVNLLNEGIRAVFDAVRECFAKLRRFSDYIQNLNPAAATERIIDELGIMRVHLTSNEKLAGMGSFVSLVEKIRLKKVSDVWGLNLFIEELSSMIENGFEEDIDIEGRDVDAVRFMNVHKAKGLEAPVVILCAPCSGNMPDPSFYTEQGLDEDGAEQTCGYIRIDRNPGAAWSKSYYEPLRWKDIEEKAKRAEALERDRLLYVAATRARNMLIVSDSAAKNNPWEKLVEMLPAGKVDMLEKAYLSDSQTSAAERERAHSRDEDIDGELNDIKARRDDAFAENRPTYRVYTPSRESGPVREAGPVRESGSERGSGPVREAGSVSQEYDAGELERAISLNTMEVIIYGEEASIKAGKLSVGNIVHRVLDVLVSNETALPETIDLILEDSDDEFITKEFLESIAEEFRNKSLWDRIKKSSKVYTEVPFSYKASADSPLSGEAHEQDTYVNGIIDLVFRENDGWVIIDYKTYDGNEVSLDLRKGYEKQLASYAEVWERITGEPVIEKEIFFVRKRIL
jgi:ATP-dependent helicase/nuclease subunit A